MSDERTQALDALNRLRDTDGLPDDERDALTRAMNVLNDSDTTDAEDRTFGVSMAAAEATGQAFERARKGRIPVLIADGGALWEVQSDGSRRRVGTPRAPRQPGPSA